MLLNDWLKTHDTTYSAFAARIGVANAKVVSRYANRERVPRPGVMARIVEATGGQVQPADFYAAREPAA